MLKNLLKFANIKKKRWDFSSIVERLLDMQEVVGA